MIANISKQTCIAKEPFFAESFFHRLRGMMLRHFSTCSFDAMIFEDCRSIHTFFMLEKIDVIFVDKNNKICLINSCVDCWKPILRCKEAYYVIELPSGMAAESRCECGDYLDLRMICCDEKVKTAGNKQLDGKLVTEIRLD